MAARSGASALPAAATSARRRTRPRLGRVFSLAALVLLSALFSVPTIWLLLTSIKRETEYASYPIHVLPSIAQPGNYALALTMFPYLRYFMNSVILATTFSVLVVLTSSAAGFGFARHPTAPGRNALFSLVLATMMVPGLVTLVPQFMLFSWLGLTNSYWPWILWGLSGSPFHIFLFRQFFAGIPRDLEDAAEVDGCGKFRIYWQIFMPNSLPAVAASTIFAFTWVWGDWLLPKLFLTDQITTLAVKLATAYVDPVQGMAIVTVTVSGVALYVLPMVLVFFFAQRYIIQGVVTSGLKG